MGACLCCCDNVVPYRTTAFRRVEQTGQDLHDRVYIVTGANGTLGTELSAALYYGGAVRGCGISPCAPYVTRAWPPLPSPGATVIMAGRSRSKVEASCATIHDRLPNASGRLVPMTLDLGDYDSILAFVREVEAAYPVVHVLVNNAGIAAASFAPSKYGHESSFQTNWLSSYVLTERLLPLLKASGAGRVVNVTTGSIREVAKPFPWGDVPRTDANFLGYGDYAESKWYLSCYTAALTRRFQASGEPLKAVLADPGAIPGSPMWEQQGAAIRFLARYVFYGLTKSPQQGAATSALLAADDYNNLVPGGYYDSGKLIGHPRPDCETPESWEQLSTLTSTLLPASLRAEGAAGGE